MLDEELAAVEVGMLVPSPPTSKRMAQAGSTLHLASGELPALEVLLGVTVALQEAERGDEHVVGLDLARR